MNIEYSNDTDIDCQLLSNEVEMPRMQWSRLEKQVESKFCGALQTNVQLHTTRFGSKGEYGKFWILLNREEIFAAYDVTALVKERQIAKQLQEINNCSDDRGAQHAAYYETLRTAKNLLHQQNVWSRYECESALKEYLNLSVEDAFASENDFIKALALFDARMGKRRLLMLNDVDLQHPLVRQFYQIRCEAEMLELALS